MNLPLGFALFIITMITCLVTDHTMVIALVIGLVGFVSIGIKKGYKIKELTSMGINGIKEATVVIEVMFLIGFITGIWRSAGTITYFVYNGIKLITPNLFIIITFLLCCVLSYALGTSFGVAGTAGVIFMALARSGGVDPI
ncbi:MAG: Na+/H+ antiporter NhaC family protein, partial [Eubacteriales bacterium]|nr:Na+/H+ antiporter NhaC family protein [Eubacteriales bacterium]